MKPKTKCDACRSGEAFPIPFTMAFQPIVDCAAGDIWGYEALVRGIDGESALSILDQVTDDTRYAFDQACRVKAIELAGEKLPRSSTSKLSINFMPNAVYEPGACISATLAAAKRACFDPTRLMFEFTENERITDVEHIKRIVAAYKKMGFLTALDDFGAGYAGLSLLAKFQTDLIKIDMEILRDIASSEARKAIVAGIIAIATALDIVVLAEGVETVGELLVLRRLGIKLFQGYLFAKPIVETFVPASSIPHLNIEERATA